MAVRPELTPTAYCTCVCPSHLFSVPLPQEILDVLPYSSDSLPPPHCDLILPFIPFFRFSSTPRLSEASPFQMPSPAPVDASKSPAIYFLSFSNVLLPCLKLLRSSLFPPLYWICDLIFSSFLDPSQDPFS